MKELSSLWFSYLCIVTHKHIYFHTYKYLYRHYHTNIYLMINNLWGVKSQVFYFCIMSLKNVCYERWRPFLWPVNRNYCPKQVTLNRCPILASVWFVYQPLLKQPLVCVYIVVLRIIVLIKHAYFVELCNSTV